MLTSKVAVVYFGKTSGDNICDCLDEIGADYVTTDYKINLSDDFTHIILSGGPMHVTEKCYMPKWILQSDAKVLGICYGMQLTACTFGGTVNNIGYYEKGPIQVTERTNDNYVSNYRWMNRYDGVEYLPDIFEVTGYTSNGHISTFTDFKKWWCVQYHPESPKYGDITIIEDFLKL